MSIRVVSLEHSRESTPQSKKIKREDENVRGADDKNDNEDDDGMTCITQL